MKKNQMEMNEMKEAIKFISENCDCGMLIMAKGEDVQCVLRGDKGDIASLLYDACVTDSLTFKKSNSTPLYEVLEMVMVNLVERFGGVAAMFESSRKKLRSILSANKNERGN